jgi:hypothetical protein
VQTMSAEAGTAIESNDYVQAVRVTLTLPSPADVYNDITGTVESWDIDRQTVTDMPDGTRLITGYPSAAANLTLSGLVDRSDETKTAAWLFNPYDSTSPMYRQDFTNIPVKIELGVHLPSTGVAEYVTSYTGVIVDYIVNPVDGTVAVVCSDGKAKLGAAPQLPLTVDGVNAYAPTVEGAIEKLIRPAFLSWPAVRANCVLAVGFRGSLVPDVGVLTDEDVSGTVNYDFFTGEKLPTLTFHPGVFGLCANIPNGVAYDLAATIPSTSAIMCETWFANDGGANTPIVLTTADGLVTATIQVHAVFVLTTTYRLAVFTTSGGVVEYNFGSTPPKYCAWQFTWTGTTLNLTVNADGVTHTASGTVDARGTSPFKSVTVTNGYIEALQITTENVGAPFNSGFTPTAVIDASLNSLTAYPEVTGNDDWATLQAIAEAEQGWAGVDEPGTFRFQNRTTIKRLTSVRNITSATSLKSLASQTSSASVANHVRVPVKPLTVGPPAFLWSASGSPIQVPARGVWTQLVDLQEVGTALQTFPSTPAAGGWAAGTSGWRASKRSDGTGGQISTGITVTAVQLSPRTVKITVANANSYPAWLVSPTGAGYPSASDGTPALNLGGKFVTAAGIGTDTNVTNSSAGVFAESIWQPSIDTRGEQVLQLPDNAWRQQVTPQQSLADDLLADLYKPRPLIRDVSIVPDPRLQLIDRVTIVDPDTSLLNGEDVILCGIHTTGGNGSYDQTLTVRAVSTPGAWLLGHAGRSELGVSTWI